MQPLSPPLMQLYLWPQRLLLLGPGFDTGLHRHHAAQVCVGLDGPLRLRQRDAADWLTHGGFYVPPDQPHEFDAGASRVAIIYLDAESAEFDALRRKLAAGESPQALRPSAQTVDELRTLAIRGGGIELANTLCLALLDLSAMQPQRRALHPRIAESLQLIAAALDRKIRLSALAQQLHVSESSLAHQFREQVGIPLRRYVLWQRLRRAIEAALQGSSLTEAAHAAGFSDSAHLSRSFRDNFGVAPSFLFEHRSSIRCIFADSSS